MKYWVFLWLFLWVSVAAAGNYDVYVLGEAHDNPHHHAEQARRVAEIAPKALVFEMLTHAQAAKATPALRSDALALAAALEWEASGWPDFGMYHPIFQAAPEAKIYGAALPREKLRRALSETVTELLGNDASRFGLNQPLHPAEQSAREALQMAAHCDALPAEVLPRMVEIQRVRDAFLARSALRAKMKTGGPVVVITGNGHARDDWGVPFMLRLAAPELSVFALLQGEGSETPAGGNDAVVFAPKPEREDPCDRFR